MAISVDFFTDFNCVGRSSPVSFSDPRGIGFGPSEAQGMGLKRSARAFCATNGGQLRIGYAGFSIADDSRTEVLNAGTLNQCINAQIVDGVQGDFDKVALERQF
jgi:hypothetical protein